jgi:transcriptional regulator GlxA family with amidase domain
LVAFDGVQSLDITGPLEVFAHASREQCAIRYQPVVASRRGGIVRTSSGMGIQTEKLSAATFRGVDTWVIAGGNEPAIRGAMDDAPLLEFLRRRAVRCRRVASVCTGAFILAEAGLLNGLCVATHWASAARLQKLYPQLQVDADAMFLKSGKFWTSAGVTAGIDMALAMVEEDLGPRVPSRIAAELVLHARRLGFQSQFSSALVAQEQKGSPIAAALLWAKAHLRGLDVPSLAAHAGVSVRSLHRLCAAASSSTPGKLIEQLRLDQARLLLSTTGLGLKEIARDCGFRDASELTRVFTRRLGLAPSLYRMTHGET